MKQVLLGVIEIRTSSGNVYYLLRRCEESDDFTPGLYLLHGAESFIRS
jgi:hypothetical protein